MWLSLLLITELCEHNHIKFTVWVNLLNVCTRILTSKWLNTELGECRLVLQGDLCQWEFCLLLIGIIVCQTLRVTDIHPPFMNHEALLQNEFYNVFLKYSSEVYIQVQLSPGSRSDCILYLMLSFLKEIVSQALCIQLVTVQVWPSFHPIFCWELLIYALRANWF